MAKRGFLEAHRTKQRHQIPEGGQSPFSSRDSDSYIGTPPSVQVSVTKIPLPSPYLTSHGSYSKLLSSVLPVQPITSSSSSVTAVPSTSSTPTPSDDLPTDEVYDVYLQSILNDYGLQLSPGGKRVEEVEQSSSETEVEEDTDISQLPTDLSKTGVKSPSGEGTKVGADAASATTYPGSKFRKITECHKISHSVKTKEEEPLQDPSLPPLPELQPLDEAEAIPGSSSKKKRKIGLYMLGPFEDPEKEKKRLNAINAYKNRVKNKKITQDLREKNNKLEYVNTQCSKALKRITGEAKKLQQEIDVKTDERNCLEDELRRKESEVREQREKLALFRGHLDLIASSLDEDNPARKLISTLLNKLPYEGVK